MSSLNSDTRVAILARMVKKAPGQTLGRTQIMKLYYFLQELKDFPLGYDFRLFNYGPFESEVLCDLSSACGLDVVVEKTVLYPRGYGYDITPGKNADKLSHSLEVNDAELAQKVDDVVREFGSHGAGELELRSTILFVDRELSQAATTTNAQDLADRVRQVKPHFSEAIILGRINEMKGKGWLKCVGD